MTAGPEGSPYLDAVIVCESRHRLARHTDLRGNVGQAQPLLYVEVLESIARKRTPRLRSRPAHRPQGTFQEHCAPSLLAPSPLVGGRRRECDNGSMAPTAMPLAVS
jgi:hypothetical protein